MLMFRIAGFLHNWIILCPPEKKELLKLWMEEIKNSARRVLWLPS